MSAELEPVNDAEVVVPLTEAEAKRLDKKIRLLVTNIADELDKVAALIAEAKTGKIHAVLGYPSWPAYLIDVGQIITHNSDDRRKIVALLSGEGMSQRAIAAVVGVSKQTVQADQKKVDDNHPPSNVIGLDDKRYPKHPNPKPKPMPAVADVVKADPARKFLDALSHVGDATVRLGLVATDLVGLELTSEQTMQLETRYERLAAKLDLLRASVSSGSVDDELRKLLDGDDG